MSPGIMRIQAQIMAQPMRKKRHTGPIHENLLLIPLQDANLHQPLNSNLMGHGMNIIPQHAGLQHPRTNLLHPRHDIVNPSTLVTKPAGNRKRPRDIRRIASILAPRIQQQIQPALQVLVVLLIVQRRGIRPGRHDGVVCLLSTPVRDTLLQEHRFQFPLVSRVSDGLQDGRVCQRRNRVRFARESDFVVVFDDAAFVDGGLESCEVLGVEGEEGDVVGDLVADGPDGGVGGRGRVAAEEGVQFCRGEDGVDVVEGEGFGGGEG